MKKKYPPRTCGKKYISRPKEENKELIERRCLGEDCGKVFLTKSKFIRLCKYCKELF